MDKSLRGRMNDFDQFDFKCISTSLHAAFIRNGKSSKSLKLLDIFYTPTATV
jgi:hypothetical protein